MTPILMYHSLATSTKKVSSPFSKYVVDKTLFEDHLALLQANDYVSLSLNDYLTKGLGLSTKSVILTFDNAFEDFELALPLLKKYGFTATLYVPTAFVGETSRWLSGSDAKRPLLSWRDLRGLAKEGIDIAAHGHKHLQLGSVPLEVAKQDILRGKDILEDKLGCKVSSVAYPYGSYNEGVKQAIQEAGFVGACTLEERLCTRQDDPFALPRLMVAGWMTADDLADLLNHKGSRMQSSYSSFKAKLWQGWRRWRVGLQGPGFQRPGLQGPPSSPTSPKRSTKPPESKS
jgi:peptidoglycan/xylan/chitin deacetylase (PgdA/CDA1 family)